MAFSVHPGAVLLSRTVFARIRLHQDVDRLAAPQGKPVTFDHVLHWVTEGRNADHRDLGTRYDPHIQQAFAHSTIPVNLADGAPFLRL
jgi:hypothetical protein